MRASGAALAVVIGSTALLAAGTPEAMRRRAAYADEGLPIILVLAIAAVASSLAGIFALVAEPTGVSALRLVLAIVNVVLGWVTLHTIAAFHYGHHYYTQARHDDEERKDAGGLSFPETPAPHLSEFLYFAFTVGMTTQTSDVAVTSPAMRRLTLVHSVVGFFYNTLIIALAVNVAAGSAR